MVRIASTAWSLAVAFAGTSAFIEAQSFQAGDALTIPSGEVCEPGVHPAAEAVRIDGRPRLSRFCARRLHGDLVAAATVDPGRRPE